MFILESKLPNLTTRKYVTTGYSRFDKLLDKYWWNKAINILPKNIAPNIISTLSVTSMMLSYLVLTPFDTTFSVRPPFIAVLTCVIFHFLCETFDALDGKQARRTNMATPLGMIVDAGCDSLTSTFIAMSVIQCMAFGMTEKAIWLLVIEQSWLFLELWEDYHTGVSRTQIWNWGCTEIEWSRMTILILSAFLSPTATILGIRLDILLLVFTSGTQGVMIILTLINTLSDSKGIVPVLHLVPLGLLNFSMFLWLQSEYIDMYAPIVLIMHGLIFSKFSWKLLVCGAVHMDFDWIHFDILFELALVLENLYLKVIPVRLGIVVFCLFATARFCIFVSGVVRQMSEFLRIRVFSMEKY